MVLADSLLIGLQIGVFTLISGLLIVGQSMKVRAAKSWSFLVGIFVLVVVFTQTIVGLSQTLTWDSSGVNPSSPVDGSGFWDTNLHALWSSSSSSQDADWSNGDTAIFGGVSGSAGTLTIADGSGGVIAGGVIFNVAGYRIAATATDILTLTSTPSIAVNGFFADTISAPLAGTTGFSKTGAGTLVLSNAATLSGIIAINNGVVNLDFSASTLANNVIGSGSTLSVAAGVLNVQGNANVSNSQAFAGTTWAQGTATISAENGSGNGATIVTLGMLTRQAGAQAIFQLPGGNGSIKQSGQVSPGLLSGAVGSTLSTSYGLIADSTGNVVDLAGVDSSGNIIRGNVAVVYSQNPTNPATNNSIGGSNIVDEYVNPQTLGLNLLANNTTASALVFDTAGTWVQTLGTNRVLTVPRILVTSGVGAGNVSLTAPQGGTFRADGTGGAGASFEFDQFNTAGYLTITCGISQGGTDSVIKNGPGTLQIFTTVGKTPYQGQTYLNGGVTEINDNSMIGLNTVGAQLNLDGGTLAASAPSGTVSVSLDSSGAHARAVVLGMQGGGLAATTGSNLTVPGVISGSVGTGTLVIGVSASSANGNVLGEIPGTGSGTANPTAMLANGTVTLSGNNSYNGGTNVVSGTLCVANASGSATGTGTVVVQNGSTLSGGNATATTGIISGAVTITSGGTLSPGILGTNNGIGSLITGGISFGSSSIINVDLSGSGNDKVISTNGLTLPSTGAVLLNLYAAGSATRYSQNGMFTLFDVTSGLVPSVNQLRSVFSVNNPVAGAIYSWGEIPDGGNGMDVTLQIKQSLGDMNQNGVVDTADILPFEQALANPDVYATAHGISLSNLQNLMDINGDGFVNNADLQQLLTNLLNGQSSTVAVSEPNSIVLCGGFLLIGALFFRKTRTAIFDETL